MFKSLHFYSENHHTKKHFQRFHIHLLLYYRPPLLCTTLCEKILDVCSFCSLNFHWLLQKPVQCITYYWIATGLAGFRTVHRDKHKGTFYFLLNFLDHYAHLLILTINSFLLWLLTLRLIVFCLFVSPISSDSFYAMILDYFSLCLKHNMT